jgi:hypothetical protein
MGHTTSRLDPKITELTRVYGGIIYRLDNSVRHQNSFCARMILVMWGASHEIEYKREKRPRPSIGGTARIIEADLFGEGEWAFDKDKWILAFELV